jgi:hypothetical protein
MCASSEGLHVITPLASLAIRTGSQHQAKLKRLRIFIHQESKRILFSDSRGRHVLLIPSHLAATDWERDSDVLRELDVEWGREFPIVILARYWIHIE